MNHRLSLLRTARGAARARGRLAAGPAPACKCSSRLPPRGLGPPPPTPHSGRRPCRRRGRAQRWPGARGSRGPAPGSPRQAGSTTARAERKWGLSSASRKRSSSTGNSAHSRPGATGDPAQARRTPGLAESFPQCTPQGDAPRAAAARRRFPRLLTGCKPVNRTRGPPSSRFPPPRRGTSVHPTPHRPAVAGQPRDALAGSRHASAAARAVGEQTARAVAAPWPSYVLPAPG